MQTHFSLEQLQDPVLADANGILRACVHCGFCTATCPTYVLLGDELDSPRGRIYLIKQMLEENRPATESDAKHIDRCLSCLSCMTTCPSGVNYMHLIDTARVHVEETFDRPGPERMLRNLLAAVMPRPGLFRHLMSAAGLAKPFAPLFERLGLKRIAAALALTPLSLPREMTGRPGHYPAEGVEKGKAVLLRGCVQSVLDPGINAATIRLLNRFGWSVTVTEGESCCGSLPHHMGKEDAALAYARRTIDQWTAENPDVIVITSSGCGTTIKDYGHMFRLDPVYAEKAKAVAAKARDISELLAMLDLPEGKGGLRVTYHSACSLQHGQQLKTGPQALLRRAGFEVTDVPEAQICCGSAGTYNILQPDISQRLRDRKLANIASTDPQVIAAGNLGCMTQLAQKSGVPVVHTVELLDWAYGGPPPPQLDQAKTNAH
ncbi:glycolate oxidase subunit GlcF [Aestuariivirga sp.]|uniref:glycolate oxidase subunit GlcF n=1 Tax=Aestuariivirga sp. TaxID=2650926 RepID=UPI0039E30667